MKLSELNRPWPARYSLESRMPLSYSKELGHLLTNIFKDKILPVKYLKKNPTFKEMWNLKKNIIIFIDNSTQGALSNNRLFAYNSDFNYPSQYIFTEFHPSRNPSQLLHNFDSRFQQHLQVYRNKMTFDALVVTPSIVNVLGGYMKLKSFLNFLTLLIILVLIRCLHLWKCHLDYYNVLKFSTYAVSSLVLANIFIYIIVILLGFEGSSKNLTDMCFTANVHGMTHLPLPIRLFYPRNNILNQGINSALRHWSKNPDQYKLNMVTIDDFHSSELVDIAIEFVKNSS